MYLHTCNLIIISIILRYVLTVCDYFVIGTIIKHLVCVLSNTSTSKINANLVTDSGVYLGWIKYLQRFRVCSIISERFTST